MNTYFVPGAVLGSGRYSVEQNREHFLQLCSLLASMYVRARPIENCKYISQL